MRRRIRDKNSISAAKIEFLPKSFSIEIAIDWWISSKNLKIHPQITANFQQHTILPQACICFSISNELMIQLKWMDAVSNKTFSTDNKVHRIFKFLFFSIFTYCNCTLYHINAVITQQIPFCKWTTWRK